MNCPEGQKIQVRIHYASGPHHAQPRHCLWEAASYPAKQRCREQFQAGHQRITEQVLPPLLDWKHSAQVQTLLKRRGEGSNPSPAPRVYKGVHGQTTWVEEIFGWMKVVGLITSDAVSRFGPDRMESQLLAIAYDLMRMAKLLAPVQEAQRSRPVTFPGQTVPGSP